MIKINKHSLPFISIITPCLNRVEYIKEAIESVLKQNYLNFEHIIVDGGSTDGTLEVLTHYPHLRIISEPDRGLYDALNKGIQIAKGDIIGWINSDDLYDDSVFQEVASKMINFPSVEIITGDSDLFEDLPNGRYIVHKDKFYSCQGLAEGRLTGIVNLNGCFFSRRIFKRIGLFNTKYYLIADHDFLIRLSIYQPVCRSIGRVVYHYRKHKGSLTWGKPRKQNLITGYQEKVVIAIEYLSIPGIPYQIYKYCQQLYQNSMINLFKYYMEVGFFAEAVKIVQKAQQKDSKFMQKFIKQAIIRGPIWLSRLLFQSIKSSINKILCKHNNA